MSLDHQRTKAEQSFIDQYARKLLVSWAHHQVTAPHDPERLEVCGTQCAYGHDVYVEYARGRGWVSKKGHRVLAKGFQVAASALKRGS